MRFPRARTGALLSLTIAATSGLGGPGAAPAPSDDPLRVAAGVLARDRLLAGRLRAASDGWAAAGEGETFSSPGWRAARQRPTAGIGGRLPARADDGWEIGIAQSPR